MTQHSLAERIDNYELVNLFVEENILVPEYVNMFWVLGRWQIEFLQSEGLTRDSTLLDVGCGALRCGIFAIDYLKDTRYCGVDPVRPYLDIGRRLVGKMGLNKEYNLICSGQFPFEKFSRKFNFGIAQSVFTHLSAEQVEDCIIALKKVMTSGGVFLFTFLERNQPKGRLYANKWSMVSGAYSRQYIIELADEYSLDVSFGSSQVHPTGQNVGRFVF